MTATVTTLHALPTPCPAWCVEDHSLLYADPGHAANLVGGEDEGYIAMLFRDQGGEDRIMINDYEARSAEFNLDEAEARALAMLELVQTARART